MLTFEIFKKYLFSQRAGSLVRTISWICMSGIGVGVFALIVVISVMNGFNDSMKARLLAIEPHLTIEKDRAHPEAYWTNLTRELRERGLQAAPFDSADTIVRTVDGYVGGAVMRGFDPEALDDLSEAARKRGGGGVMPKLKPGEVWMGVDLAVSLGIFEGAEIVVVAPEALLMPKGEVPVYEKLKVKAILTTNVQDIDSKMIFYLRGQNLKRFHASVTSGIEVRLANLDEAGSEQARLSASGVKSQTWAQRNSALFYALRLEKISIGLFLSLSALIASFSIVAVLMLLMMQKRKDLGLLMALGLSQKRTRWTFTSVGLLLSFAGIGGGLIAGLAVSLLLQTFPLNVLPAIYHDRSLPATVNYTFVAGVVAVASLIAFVSSWLPAWRNTRLTPSEALRGRARDAD